MISVRCALKLGNAETCACVHPAAGVELTCGVCDFLGSALLSSAALLRR
jgi:hypothetical protein